MTRASRCRPLVVTLLLLLGPSGSRAAADDQRDVVAAVQRVFDALAACDAAAIGQLTMPEGRLYRLSPGAGATPRSSTFEEFRAQVASCSRPMLERMWQPQVRVHKDIATVWAPYDFWVDGAFSHCGVDSFELVRTADGWKLTSGLYTVEKEGCAPSPLGPPPTTGNR